MNLEQVQLQKVKLKLQSVYRSVNQYSDDYERKNVIRVDYYDTCDNLITTKYWATTHDCDDINTDDINTLAYFEWIYKILFDTLGEAENYIINNNQGMKLLFNAYDIIHSLMSETEVS